MLFGICYPVTCETIAFKAAECQKNTKISAACTWRIMRGRLLCLHMSRLLWRRPSVAFTWRVQTENAYCERHRNTWVCTALQQNRKGLRHRSAVVEYVTGLAHLFQSLCLYS